MKPLAIFGGMVGVGLAVIFAGLRLTNHSANAGRLPTPLTHAQFVREGNAICDRYYREGKAIFKSKPKTLKMLTRDLRLLLPLMEGDAAGIRGLLPPASDTGSYQRLLSVTEQELSEAHATLHAFETQQVLRGVLLARRVNRLDNRYNALSRKLGLTACAKNAPQASSGSAERARSVASPAVHKASSAATPHLTGSYRTSLRILVDTHQPPVPTGFTGVRTWTFVPHCSSVGCTTTLYRPSILPGSTVVYRYFLHAVSGGRYRGMLDVPAVCYSTGAPPAKVLPPGSGVDHEVITLWPTRTRAGKVVEFAGTMLITYRPSRWGSEHGCVSSGYQKSIITSTA